MKKTTTIGMVFIVIVLVTTVVVWRDHDRELQRLSPQEKATMEYLPGYSFVLDGKRIEIKKKWTHKGFLEQHRMVPFLEDIVPLLQTCHWKKDRPPLKSRKRKIPSLFLSPLADAAPAGKANRMVRMRLLVKNHLRQENGGKNLGQTRRVVTFFRPFLTNQTAFPDIPEHLNPIQ